MAKNNRDRLIETFLSRSRNTRRTKKGVLPRVGPTTSSGGGLTRFGANIPPSRITEDDPRWNARTMGNRTGYHKGVYYERGKKSRGARNYNKGNRPG
jgi:hypothetical protein